MTIRIPDDGDDKPDSTTTTTFSMGTFASAWQQDGPDPGRGQFMNINQQQSFTGVRINMAGELLTGMMRDDSSIESQLDSVELGVIQEHQQMQAGKIKADMMKQTVDPAMMMSPNKGTHNTYETSSDEEEARLDEKTIEAIYGRRYMAEKSEHRAERRRQEEAKLRRRSLVYDKFRCWKSPEKMVGVFFVIMVICVYLSFRSRSGDKTLSWDAN